MTHVTMRAQDNPPLSQSNADGGDGSCLLIKSGGFYFASFKLASNGNSSSNNNSSMYFCFTHYGRQSHCQQCPESARNAQCGIHTVGK